MRMEKEMLEKIQNLKRAIMEEIPQIPFVQDQVGFALKLCVEYHREADVVKVLEAALEVAKYVKSISEINFYKTHLLVASLIGDIPNIIEDDRFKVFKTASQSVEKAIQKVSVDPKLMEERGCFNAITIHLTRLAKEDEECFVIMLYGILYDLKEVIAGMKKAGVKAPITPQDYITIMGYAYVMANLRMANLSLLFTTKDVINEIEIILNTDVIY